MNSTINAPCKTCHGDGSQTTIVDRGQLTQLPCADCDGAGETERSVESLMEEACRLDDKIKARTAEIITPLQNDLDELKALIASIVIAGGETVRTQFGRVEYVRAGECVSWDDRALLGFAVAHPEILSMRSAKETAPTTRIKFEVKP
jgi:hypothetical protein